MRIRVWNAFASNNSGSYTIVGSFSTGELASEIAPLLHHDRAAAATLLHSVPVTVMSNLVRARAERAAALLREAGATVTVKEEPREA